MKADEIRRFDGNQFTQWRKSIECALVEEKCLAAIKEAKRLILSEINAEFVRIPIRDSIGVGSEHEPKDHY